MIEKTLFLLRHVPQWLWRASALALIVAAPALAAAAEDPGEETLHYLNHTIEWYRHVTALGQSAGSSQDVVFRNAIHQNASQVLHLAFAYARGRAALLAAEKPAGRPGSGSGREKTLAQAAAAASLRVTQIQADLDRISQQIGATPATAPANLTARRDKLAAELNLAKARQDVLRDFVGFSSGSGGTAGLSQRIDDLEHATPEIQAAASGGKPVAASATEEAPRPESAGILSLVTEIFTSSTRGRELNTLAVETTELHKRCDALRAPLRTELQEAIKSSDALSQTKESDDAKILDAQRKQLDALAVKYKLLAAAALPLGEQNILLDSVEANAQQWHTAVDRGSRRVIRALIIRLGAIAGAILVLLVISSFWRRATFRYISDARRRRQFLSIRRIVVGAIILVILVTGFVTEFGSLATFAGLITAGIAVALQTVILSGFAHFFFMGRYGVRVGDRVTISGITGDIIDIGILRLYLMEMAGDDRGVNPTGRVAVFSNSVLFQASAFFKQLPGADYTWHEMALTLAPETNYQLAETRLMAAIESVVAEYRDTIKKQYSILSKSEHFQVPPPEPHGRLRFVDAGIEFVVRYPVEVRRAADIDDQITRKVLETIDQEPSLRLVVSGTPKIQAAGARAG
jgi:small-conductance mechanosensitive channel